MASDDLGLLQGTLDLLVLKVLAWGPQHGYGIARQIKSHSADALSVEDRARRSTKVDPVIALRAE